MFAEMLLSLSKNWMPTKKRRWFRSTNQIAKAGLSGLLGLFGLVLLSFAIMALSWGIFSSALACLVTSYDIATGNLNLPWVKLQR